MTKSEMANYLADTEVSVKLGEQTRTYWVNAHMRKTKAELEKMVDRRTAPGWAENQAVLFAQLAR
jgi:hypothetical protein